MLKHAPNFRVKHWLLVLLIAGLSGCSYGPERYQVYFESIASEPGTHRFAFAVDWTIIREPQGFIATFPNGGIPRVIEQEARLYLVDLRAQSIEKIAQLKDYGGVPVPKSIYLYAWRPDGVYFTISGYGSSSWRGGDDTNDPRDAHFRVTDAGTVTAVNAPPKRLPRDLDSASKRPSPFWIHDRRTDLRIEFKTGSAPAQRDAFVRIDEITGEPYITNNVPD